MAHKKDHPGIYIPPPLIYVAAFVAAIFIQSEVPILNTVFNHKMTKAIGILFIIIAVCFFLFRSLKSFMQSKNTVVTVLPANSLQTTGIYAITRNSMYVALALIYLGIACFIGNWWHIILFPFLLLIVQEYVMKREEKYLFRRFGQDYVEYRKQVRRWL